MAYDIYLSYGRRHQALAVQYADALRAEGLRVWYDSLAQTADAAAAALADSRLLVVLFSKSSNDSDQLSQEIALADREGVPVIPILIENARPRGEMLYELGPRNWIPLHPNPAAKTDQLVDALSELLGIVREAEQAGEGSVEAKKLSEELGAPEELPFLPFRWPDIVWVTVFTGFMMIIVASFPLETAPDWAKAIGMSFALGGLPILTIRFVIRFVRSNQKLSRSIPVFGLLSIIGGILIFVGYDIAITDANLNEDHQRVQTNAARGLIFYNFFLAVALHILMRGYIIAYAFRQRLLGKT